MPPQIGTGRFQCFKCGYFTKKWRMICEGCGGMETLRKLPDEPKGVPISKVQAGSVKEYARISTGLLAVDEVLGGGLVPGSVLFLGGEPGRGKSTLLLWVAQCVAEKGKKVLYVAGEESAEAVSQRGKRIGAVHADLTLLSHPDTHSIYKEMKAVSPSLVFVDSLQTCLHPEWEGYPPGSPTQLKACMGALITYARLFKSTLWMIGHVDKNGNLMGPNTLMHAVDAVLYLEGDPNESERQLLAVKNRYGDTSPVALLEMTANGLKEPAPKEDKKKGKTK